MCFCHPELSIVVVKRCHEAPAVACSSCSLGSIALNVLNCSVSLSVCPDTNISSPVPVFSETRAVVVLKGWTPWQYLVQQDSGVETNTKMALQAKGYYLIRDCDSGVQGMLLVTCLYMQKDGSFLHVYDILRLGLAVKKKLCKEKRFLP